MALIKAVKALALKLGRGVGGRGQTADGRLQTAGEREVGEAGEQRVVGGAGYQKGR